ncbi:MAG: aldo/keto reductase [Bacteroidota bacterium]
MIQRPIPSTNEMLPVIGLGTWARFDVGSSDKRRSPLREVLTRMSIVGGMMIDSSPMYGRSESVIGDLTANSVAAEKFFYATKVWTTGEASGIQQMNESPRRMRRTVMDLIQVHNLVDWQTHLRTLERWKKEGKVRYTGITHYKASAHDELERIINAQQIDFVQFNYSIRERNAERRLLASAHDRGVAVIINEPLEKGSLLSLVKGKALPPWAAEYDIQSWGEFFLKFIVSHPSVTCVIPATANPDHMSSNIRAGSGLLPDEQGRNRMAAFIQSL